MQCLVPAKEPDVAPGIPPDNTYVIPLQKPLYTKREVLKRPWIFNGIKYTRSYMQAGALHYYIEFTATQQTRDIAPVLFQWWDSVADAAPTLKQHWVNVSSLLGSWRAVFQRRIFSAPELNAPWRGLEGEGCQGVFRRQSKQVCVWFT